MWITVECGFWTCCELVRRQPGLKRDRIVVKAAFKARSIRPSYAAFKTRGPMRSEMSSRGTDA
jgi:hypothetical protein